MASRPARVHSLLHALDDPGLFGPWFRGESWGAWRVLLKALFALPLSEAELEVFRRFTGRKTALTDLVREAWFIIGRRGGKSLMAALLAVWCACFRDYSKILAPGERGTVMVIAPDRRQARVIFRYIVAFLERVPALARLIERKTVDSIYVSNGIAIEVHTASFRTTRGYTIVAAIIEEVAFLPTEESANPDMEIINAIRPGMATVPGSLLLCISSPYARRGALWQAYRDHYGQDGDPVLVWKADTRSMNPTVDERVVLQAYTQDEAVASAEYGAEFRRDVEGYVSRETVEERVVAGRRELPPVSGIEYVSFVDPSGGSQDSMTLAIAHHEDGRAVLDLVREVRPPFSPEEVVREFAKTTKAYRVPGWIGDRYGGEWPRDAARRHGTEYRVAEQTKSELYRELLPLLNSGRVELLDSPRLVAQLCGLERRTARGGRDSIDHGPGGHDDVANAAAGALVLALGEQEAEVDLDFVALGEHSWASGRPLGAEEEQGPRDVLEGELAEEEEDKQYSSLSRVRLQERRARARGPRSQSVIERQVQREGWWWPSGGGGRL